MSAVKQIEVTAFEVHQQPGLDPIMVFFRDSAPGAGYVTIVCFSGAWSSWFGAMGDRSIRQFFCECGTDYLLKKLGFTQWLKQTRAHEKYLGRIIDAVKESLKQEEAVHAALPDAGRHQQ